MQRPNATGGNRYTHDAISDDELFDLIGYATSGAVAPPGPPELPAKAKECVSRDERVEFEGAELRSFVLPQRPETAGAAAPVEGQPDAEDAVDAAGLFVHDADLDGLELEFVDLDGSEIESQALSFDILDIDVEEEDEPEDSQHGIDREQRARQQAIAFLAAIGELTGQHVEWVVEIILARRWSTAQGRVHELWCSGYSVRAIHMAFLLVEAWRESDAYDERLDGYPRRAAWMSACRPQLSWWEAMQIVAFHGDDCSIDEMLIFIEAERHIWRSSSRLRGRFTRFKEYLLRQRIADECRSPGGGWYRTLDPRDGRSFDGSGNPEYTDQWWEDELPALGGSQYVQRRIYMGEQLGTLIVEPDDGLHWLED